MAISMESIKSLRAATGAGIVDCKNALEASNGDVDAAADWLREKGIAKAAKKASRIAAEGLTAVAIDGNYAAIIEINSETDFAAKSDKFQALVKNLVDATIAAKAKDLDSLLAYKHNGSTVNEMITNATATIGEKISFRRFEILEKAADQSFGSYIHMGGKIAVVSVVKGANNEELAKDIAMHIAALSPSYIGIDNVPADVVEHEQHIQMEAAKNDPKLAGKPEQALVKILEGKVRKSLSEVCLLEQEFVKDPSKKVGIYVTEKGSAIINFVRYGVGEGMQHREENFADEVMSQMK